MGFAARASRASPNQNRHDNIVELDAKRAENAKFYRFREAWQLEVNRDPRLKGGLVHRVATEFALEFMNRKTLMVWPSIDTLAAKLQASPKAVRRAVHQLAKYDHVKRVSEGGGRASTCYLPVLAAKPGDIAAPQPQESTAEAHAETGAAMPETRTPPDPGRECTPPVEGSRPSLRDSRRENPLYPPCDPVPETDSDAPIEKTEKVHWSETQEGRDAWGAEQAAKRAAAEKAEAERKAFAKAHVARVWGPQAVAEYPFSKNFREMGAAGR
jgi:hypothetical protein